MEYNFGTSLRKERYFTSLWMPVGSDSSRLINVAGTDSKVAKSPCEPWDLSQNSREVLGSPDILNATNGPGKNIGTNSQPTSAARCGRRFTLGSTSEC